MDCIKKFLAVAGMVGMFSLSSAGAFAASIGVVNLDDIGTNYSKAQDANADLKVKDAELQKFLADAQKQLKDASTPLERKNLETKLTNEYKQRSTALADMQEKMYKQVLDNIFSAIDTVAKTKKLDVVLSKSSVLVGGTDITNDVLTLLNAKK